ncbi:hypothetical protein C942_00487 [Photobacterium marinum]|uniref:Uncharacterized protein n=1 Tax=Photobacterium marinum TaxID=1056511 RepID=L8JB09_9GAMM|nr:hypothetical protein [Photobacterium marinum]ELR66045.1 hypothetical protein C942_00487 [Photobacterium marinum]
MIYKLYKLIMKIVKVFFIFIGVVITLIFVIGSFLDVTEPTADEQQKQLDQSANEAREIIARVQQKNRGRISVENIIYSEGVAIKLCSNAVHHLGVDGVEFKILKSRQLEKDSQRPRWRSEGQTLMFQDLYEAVGGYSCMITVDYVENHIFVSKLDTPSGKSLVGKPDNTFTIVTQ